MPSVSRLLKAIQHPIRRQIMDYIGESLVPTPYTQLLPFCGHSTGKLNYHIKILSGIIQKDEIGYILSIRGKKIVRWLTNILEEADPAVKDKPSVVIDHITPSNKLFTKFIGQYTIVILTVAIALVLVSELVMDKSAWVFYLIIPYLFGIWFLRAYVNSISYHITNTEILVNKGVITKTQKIVMYRTVTNMELKEGLFDKYFKMATVEIHTAGNTTVGAEEKIIGMLEAEEIKETILERIRLLNPPDFLVGTGKTNTESVNALPILRELQSLNDELRD